jgi:steroid delta-isomerase-like uncharacterized protein
MGERNKEVPVRTFIRYWVAFFALVTMTFVGSLSTAGEVAVEFAQKAACGMCNDCADCAACCAKGMCAMDNKTEAANAAANLSFYEKVFNGGDFAFVDTLVAPDFQEHQAIAGMPPSLKGPEAVKAMAGMMRAAFPDVKATVEGVYVRGDDVITRYRMTGTNTGETMGMPATGKKVDVTGIDWVRFKDGKATDHWGASDDAGMMRQLGMMPEMPGTGGMTAKKAMKPSKKDIGEKMSPEAAEKAVRRFYDEMINKRNLDILDEMVAPDFIDHSPSMNADTVEDQKAIMKEMIGAFPDLNVMIDDLVVVGDKVIVRWTMTGTNSGELMGMPATGKSVKVSGISVDRVGGGKIHEHWENWDELGFMAQLGLVPGMDGMMAPEPGK